MVGELLLPIVIFKSMEALYRWCLMVMTNLGRYPNHEWGTIFKSVCEHDI